MVGASVLYQCMSLPSGFYPFSSYLFIILVVSSPFIWSTSVRIDIAQNRLFQHLILFLTASLFHLILAPGVTSGPITFA